MKMPFGMESFGPVLWRGTRGSSTGDGGVFFLLKGRVLWWKGGIEGIFLCVCIYVYGFYFSSTWAEFHFSDAKVYLPHNLVVSWSRRPVLIDTFPL